MHQIIAKPKMKYIPFDSVIESNIYIGLANFECLLHLMFKEASNNLCIVSHFDFKDETPYTSYISMGRNFIIDFEN